MEPIITILEEIIFLEQNKNINKLYLEIIKIIKVSFYFLTSFYFFYS